MANPSNPRPVVVTLDSPKLIKSVDLISGYTEYIPRDDFWVQTSPEGFSILYNKDRWISTLFNDPALNMGSSIFGATTSALLTAVLIETVESTGGGGGGGGTTTVNPSDITSGVNSSNVIGLLTSIRSELQTSKSIADIIVQDSSTPTPRYYVRQEVYNDTLSTSFIAFFNLDGSAAAPAPLLPVVPFVGSKDRDLLSTEYTATIAGTGYSVGDIVTRVSLIDTADGSVFSTAHFNLSTGLSIAPFSLNNVKSTADESVELLKAISDRIQLYRVKQGSAGSAGTWVSGDLIRYTPSANSFFNLTKDAVIVTANNPLIASQLTPIEQVSTAIIGASSEFVNQVGAKDRITGAVTKLQTVNTVADGDALVVRSAVIDTLGNTQIVGADQATKVYTQLTNGSISPRITGSGGAPTAADNALVTSLSPNSADINPNRSLSTAAYSLITDGTTTAKVNPASTSPIVTDAALTVSLSPNSADTRPNRTAANAAFARITNGAIDATIKASSAASVIAETSLVVQRSPNDFSETSARLRAIVTAGALTNGEVFIRVIRNQSDTGAVISTRYYRESNGSNIPGGDAGLVGATVVAAGSAAEPNQSLTTAAFSIITDGTNTAKVSPASTVAITTDPALVVQLSPNTPDSNPNRSLSTTAFTKVSNGTDVVSVLATTSNTVASDRALLVSLGANNNLAVNLNTVNGEGLSLGVKTTALSLPVALPTDVADINPNRSLATSAFVKIGNGTLIADIKSSAAIAADNGLLTRSIPDSLGNTQTISSTASTALFSKIVDSAGNQLKILPSGTTATVSDPSLVVQLSPNTPDIVPNRLITTAGFQKITDGTNTAKVSPASTVAITTDPALVVQLSPNTPNMAGLAPSTTATNHSLAGGQYLATPPVLSNNQQLPILLDSSGSQVVSERVQPTVSVGQINPAGDTPLVAGKKVYRISYTNTSAVVIFIQIYNSTAALVSGTSVPLLGLVFRIPPNSSFILDEATLSSNGELFGANTRIAISTTFGVYTPPNASDLLLMSLSIKTAT